MRLEYDRSKWDVITSDKVLDAAKKKNEKEMKRNYHWKQLFSPQRCHVICFSIKIACGKQKIGRQQWFITKRRRNYITAIKRKTGTHLVEVNFTRSFDQLHRDDNFLFFFLKSNWWSKMKKKHKRTNVKPFFSLRQCNDSFSLFFILDSFHLSSIILVYVMRITDWFHRWIEMERESCRRSCDYHEN